jgi:DNA helicase HerA-like ATPase
MINVIDFSRNSELSPFEEMVILNRIVDKAISLAVKYRIPVFFVIDEIQNIMLDPLGRESINKILREGRSLGVTLIYATQYFHGIKDKNLLINGTTHIGIVGRIASEADYKTLKAIAPDIDEDLLLVECYNIDDFEKLKNKGRFKGYFIYGKAFTEYLKYRPPQSL